MPVYPGAFPDPIETPRTPPAPVHTAPPAPPAKQAAPPITQTAPAAPRDTVAQPNQPPPAGAVPPLPGETPAPKTPPAPRNPAAPSTVAPPASSPAAQAGQVVTVHQAEPLQAPQQDVAAAKATVPAEHRPDPAPQTDVDNLRRAIGSPSNDNDGRNPDGQDSRESDPGRPDPGQQGWDHQVRQWDRDWVRYDDDWRPVICNPYQTPAQIVYDYDGSPQIVVIPPLQSAVLDVADYGAYNFTAVVLDAVGQAADVAVGSFFGGGYDPGPDLPPPPPPPPVQTYDDVPVSVDYPDATYQPFVVNQVVDAGDDPQYGEHKVLLDGVTPVWGQWTQTPDGQREFDVNKTQQFPGLDAPAPGPLPGNYQLQLASKTSPAMPARDLFIVAASGVVATLGACAGGFAALRWRRARARARQ
jgi:hypothetical protein